eukprot:CAMPEP_0182878842 /NCGR_PEP_ID=MMETSP0034_2-20130328/15601_1 /TAXON_ID=156128 /ORGANISM="Nephroselmis pyriformis, Strain CCMP717" /LENGTH=112 /DNA_ID=CAMNT_0025011739 /DNA_START=31 /DNA_END=365 /DNA_ORIENTATION=+
MSKGYVGSQADVLKMRRLEQQRSKEHEQHELLRKEKEEKMNGASLRQFGTSSSEAVENAFRQETVGLVSKEEFASKRKTIEKRLKDEEQAASDAAKAKELKNKKERERKRQS